MTTPPPPTCASAASRIANVSYLRPGKVVAAPDGTLQAAVPVKLLVGAATRADDVCRAPTVIDAAAGHLWYGGPACQTPALQLDAGRTMVPATCTVTTSKGAAQSVPVLGAARPVTFASLQGGGSAGDMCYYPTGTALFSLGPAADHPGISPGDAVDCSATFFLKPSTE